MVDLVDDLELARQQLLKVVQRPLLKRLGKQRVVGVGQGASRQIPGLIPPQLRVVEQDAHQFGDREGGMRIVELDRRLVRQGAPVSIVAPETPHEIGERAGNKEILLHEAQALPHFGGVIRIEHAGHGVRSDAPDERADKVARAELLKVETIVRRGAPQTQAVDGLTAEADHGPVVRNADQSRGTVRNDLQASLMHFERAAEFDLDGLAAT